MCFLPKQNINIQIPIPQNVAAFRKRFKPELNSGPQFSVTAVLTNKENLDTHREIRNVLIWGKTPYGYHEKTALEVQTRKATNKPRTASILS